MQIMLIGDDKVKAIPVDECGDPMVDLAREFGTLTFDTSRKHVQTRSKSISFGRSKVGQMLVSAQKALPDGIKLLIKECYRPLWIQREFFEGYSAYLRKQFPHWDDVTVYDECCKLNAPVEVAPHSTGGAVDLTLIDSNRNWFEMGTEFNADPIKTKGATYTLAENISHEARRNRELLSDAMSSVGFVNYPTEWWHWSYGDKYWALLTESEKAIFASIEDLEMKS